MCFNRLCSVKIKNLNHDAFAMVSAEVGGLCGLFLGASLVTVAELVEFCVMAVKFLFQRERKLQTKVQQFHEDPVETQAPKY